MYSKEKRVLLREYLRDGWSKSAVARRFGVSRRTVHHWIATGQLDRELDEEPVRYRRRPEVERKIDPYVGIIHERLEAYEELSAVRLFEEIRQAGYDGGYTQVKEYVRKVRPQPVQEPVIRFETPPGHQAQVDFAKFELPWGPLFALLVVLGYSRLMWVRFFARQTMAVVMDGLEQAFRFFGGVPRELLFDQMKAVITDDQRPTGGRVIENLEFMRFAHHWGFKIRACRPYRAQTKGKVERPISYLRRNFFYAREFTNEADLDAQLRRWLDETANVRIHGTTGELPVERFQRDERTVLQPLASSSYRTVTVPRRTLITPQVPIRLEVERRSLSVYRELAGGTA
jgi:transposase